jgi:predicted nucleic acid-binding protein
LPEVICNTSPLQYLHQLGQLGILASLTRHIIVPRAVVDELAAGRTLGVDLPVPEKLEWVTVRVPVSKSAIPLVTDLGMGETEVLALALESTDCVTILDDALGRRVAAMLGLRVRGTLGLLLDAKRAGLITAVAPLLNQLQVLGFRLSPQTAVAVLGLAGENP